jgi:hypothetical protein
MTTTIITTQVIGAYEAGYAYDGSISGVGKLCS